LFHNIGVLVVNKVVTKSCTKCGETKSSEQFYSLGKDRVDSWCKQCKKSARQAAYVSKADLQNYNAFRKFLDFFFNIELTELCQYDQRLEEIINHAKSKERCALQSCEFSRPA